MKDSKHLTIQELAAIKLKHQEQIDKINHEISKKAFTTLEGIRDATLEDDIKLEIKMLYTMIENNVPLNLENEINRISQRFIKTKRTKSWEEALGELEYLSNSLEFPSKWGMNGLKLYRGKPILIGAFSGVGKSTFLVNMIYHYLMSDKKILVFSNEMIKGEYLARLIQFFDFQKKKKPEDRVINYFEICKNKNNFGYLKTKWEKNVIIFDDEDLTATDIHHHIDVLKDVLKIDLVFIDYIQNLEIEEDFKSFKDNEQLKSIMKVLTKSSKKTKLPYIIAAQTNRQSKKDGINDHSAFEGSGALEKNAALTLLLSKSEEEPNKIFGNVSKNRFGRIGKMEFEIDPDSRFIIEGKKIT